MTNPMTICLSLAASLVAALAGACATEPLTDDAQSITIADPSGGSRTITLSDVHRGATESYAVVSMEGRDFTLAQWIDAESGDRHSVVSSNDGDVRYEHIAGASGAQVVLTDADGARAISDGDSLGTVDEDAATLLMNLRPVDGVAGESAYVYETYCVGYDTSDPDDWHLFIAPCTCAHWYSLICEFN